MPDRPALPHVWCDGAAPEGFGPSVVSVGVFDGVHRGHRIVVGQAAATGEQLGLPTVVVTFDPNPAEVVAGATAPTRLCSVSLRAELLVGAGADAVWVVPFTTELSRMTPEEFVRMLVAHVAPAAVVVGADFRFGHRATGDVGTLTELGQRYGFTVEPVQMHGRDGDRRPGGAWSSTAVRRLLEDGDVQGAADVLTRPHRVEGEVVHGDHRGRELGYPTANLDVDPRAAVPADGVYAGWLVRASGERLPAAISVGTNPTFDGRTRRVEAYVVDAGPDLDLYGERVALDFVGRVRGMERFDAVPDLVAQMGRDVDQVRALLVSA